MNGVQIPVTAMTEKELSWAIAKGILIAVAIILAVGLIIGFIVGGVIASQKDSQANIDYGSTQ